KLNNELNGDISVELINLFELVEILEAISNCIDCKIKSLNNNEIKILLGKLIELLQK
ncbi:18396_t:CDS:2, partial [Entrophospora sp. SA101]